MAISISTFVSLSSSSPSSLTTNSINQQLTFLQSSSSSSSNIQSFRTLVRNNSIISSSSSSSSSSSNRTKHRFQVRSISQPNPQPSQFHTKNDPTVPIPQVDSSSSSPSLRVLDTSSVPNTDNNGGSRGGDNSNDGNGNGKCTGGGGGGDGEGDQGDHDDDDDDVDEQELGPIMKFEQVIKETKARGVTLPDDMLEAAKTVGIPKILLLRYLDLQGSIWPIGFGMRTCSLLRNRMLADPSFLFKVGIEVLIDSCCATFAEVQKRGENFWAEFELFVADLLVGVVVDIALVGLLAPYVRIGQPSISKGLLGRIQHLNATLPSSVFEAERPGCRFSVQQRVATYFYKGVLYGSVGFVCGLIGQGIANSIMNAKRSIKKSEEDVAVPPLFKSAALWGVFLAVSSNTRYQIVNGLERVVEASPLGKQVPPFAMAFTVGIRFANNIYAGMQFVDWARWSGCQ